MLHIIPTALIATTATVSFSAFCWGVKSHFRSTGKMPLGMQVTSALSTIAFLWFIARLTSGFGAMWLEATALFCASGALFFWTIQASRQTPPTLAFDTDAPFFLLRSGPYAAVRHPFYLSYLMFWVGTALATASALGWIAVAIMAAVYLDAATREEAKFARSTLAATYAAYKRQAGMFLPRADVTLGMISRALAVPAASRG